MADLTAYVPINAKIGDYLKDGYHIDGDPREAFVGELKAAGFSVPKSLSLGRLQRIDSPGDRKGQQTGWCIYHEVDDAKQEGRVVGVGVYGSWRGNPEKVVWTSKSTVAMTDSERLAYNTHLEYARVAREEEQRLLNAEAAKESLAIYNAAHPATDNHPYLVKKGIPALGAIRVSKGDLVVPVYSAEGQVASLQFIKADGTKRFKSGGRKRGCFFAIAGDNSTIYIAEGYATAASIHMATGNTVYVAFDAGNLYEVTTLVANMHQGARIVVAGDDDQFSAGNAGRTKATQAAETIGAECVFPTFANHDGKPTDWNDLHTREGLDAVKAQLKPKPALYKAKGAKTVERGGEESVTADPVGILRELVHYYNATSGNKQPGFAVQTAIAICSVILARNFTTNLANRSSVYLLNLGKSATGKEHCKRVVERVLEACGEQRLIGPDGYTAGSAVFSALVERPRHVTVIDEFSKYLQAAQNKYSSSHMMEANSQLMQAFGRLDGTLRPKSYSTVGLPADKRKEFAEMFVRNPAITLVAMSTPEDLFDKLEISSIKDGFLNRFLVCISDAPRSVRRHKEPLPVPQSIIDWAATINIRRGPSPDTATQEPTVQTLVFDTDAIAMQEAYQEECIALADGIEKFGLAEMPMRCNEIAMRLALIQALARDPNAETITPDDIAWAIGWVRLNMQDLIHRLKMSVAGSEFEGMKKATLAAIRQAGERGVPFSRMQVEKPYSTYREKDLKEVLTALENADLIYKEGQKTGARGRPVVIYYALAS